MKKFLLAVLSVLLIASASAGGTIAYLSTQEGYATGNSTANARVKQIEQARNSVGDLVTFAQGQQVFPAVYGANGIALEEDGNKWPVPNDKAWQILDTNTLGVHDKFVTVENKSRNGVYVRNWFAVEGGVGEKGLVHLFCNGAEQGWSYAELGNAEIDGVTYGIVVMTYEKVLEKGKTTPPSLKQFYLDCRAGNFEIASFNGVIDILVITQATNAVDSTDTQSNGPSQVYSMLDAAFGEPKLDNNPWNGRNLWEKEQDSSYTEEGNVITVSTAEQLAAVAARVNGGDSLAGKTVYLVNDIDLRNESWTPIGSSAATPFAGTFDGNGKTVYHLNVKNAAAGLFGYIVNGSVSHLNVDQVELEAAGPAGAIAAYLNGSISDCSVTNAEIKGETAGAVAGITAGNGIDYSDLTYIHSVKVRDAIVSAAKYAGAVAGECGSFVQLGYDGSMSVKANAFVDVDLEVNGSPVATVEAGHGTNAIDPAAITEPIE